MLFDHPPRKEDYRFSVVGLDGLSWDVYAFRKDGKDGTLAFTWNPSLGKWVIGLFCAGTLSQEQVTRELAGACSDA